MEGALNIVSEIAGSAAALAGLILVFLGAALNSFDAHEATEHASVRCRYRWRVWPSLTAFILALASSGFALYAKAFGAVGHAEMAIWLIGISGIGLLVSAIAAVLEIG